MAQSNLTGPSIINRYETYTSKIMTLYITRQNQEFVTQGDDRFCDMELIYANVNLVGEPGLGNVGSITADGEGGWRNTINSLHAVNDFNAGQIDNRIISKSFLDHQFVNTRILGMHEGVQFQQDYQAPGNAIQLLIPTDFGLSALQTHPWPPTPFLMERVRLKERMRIETEYAGTLPIANRVARFVEDWADIPETGITKRNTDGTVRYFIGDIEGQGTATECQVPANCISSMKLIFKISPRKDL